MRSALLIILTFCCSFARADSQSIQFLHEVSSNGYLFTASMMVYFNPKDRTPDDRSLAGAFGAATVMDTKITQLGDQPEMRTRFNEMNKIFLTLERTKRSEAAIFPENVQRVLQLNKELQEIISTQYQAEMASTPSPVALLNSQSLQIAHLLMDYQLRRYPLEDKSAFSIDPAQLPAIDQQIEKNFDVLLKKYPSHADYLAPASKNYRFVRKQLLQAKGRPNGGAEFYISRTVLDLNEVAVSVSLESEGLDADNPQDR
ncbi:hypothetical protein [Pseudomonas sp. N040]|uniref:hypothetical protein n=1 Tax=Pseudomonas sp. N040 TaxID=2785325 RepID=UPI0018A29C53|nr:hypothetical protein [Pseudomonas sp. N040]MBF7729396.1 hypothetical protein [Pseudomonas sp. N040]MBW7013036.1 hypothetical protein [Pseudomonas sp. N040]